MIDIKQGDCLELMKNLPDGSVDCILTDPPYNLLKGHKIETGVDMEAVFDDCFRVLKKGGFLVYFGMQPSITEWNYFCMKKFLYKSEIIWYKRGNSGTMGDISRVFENIMVFNKLEKTRFNDVYRPYHDVKESIGDFYDFKSLKKFINLCKNIFTQKWQFEIASEYFEKNYDFNIVSKVGKRKVNDDYYQQGVDCFRFASTVKHINRGVKQQNLISFVSENQKNRGEGGGVNHPTVKPTELFKYLLEITTNPNQTILDPFMGSGTTGIACVNLDRNFIGFELDPEYFKIAQARIQKAKDKKDEMLM